MNNLEDKTLVYLIVGSTGAGKTTYAKSFSNQVKATIYSIDDWMKALYWQDMPPNPSNEWFLENGKWYVDRIERCEKLIWTNTLDRIGRKEPTILDLGFSTKDHRIKFINKCKDIGASAEIHFVDVDADTRWDRVQKRNSEKGSTFAMTVDRGMFEYIESIFQAPTDAEGAKVVRITPPLESK